MNYKSNYETNNNMVWKTKEGFLRPKDMSTNHIVNTIKLIKKNKENDFCGHSSMKWLNVLRSELKRRDALGNAVLAIFPKVFKEFNDITSESSVVSIKKFTTKNL